MWAQLILFLLALSLGWLKDRLGIPLIFKGTWTLSVKLASKEVTCRRRFDGEHGYLANLLRRIPVFFIYPVVKLITVRSIHTITNLAIELRDFFCAGVMAKLKAEQQQQHGGENVVMQNKNAMVLVADTGIEVNSGQDTEAVEITTPIIAQSSITILVDITPCHPDIQLKNGNEERKAFEGTASQHLQNTNRDKKVVQHTGAWKNILLAKTNTRYPGYRTRIPSQNFEGGIPVGSKESHGLAKSRDENITPQVEDVCRIPASKHESVETSRYWERKAKALETKLKLLEEEYSGKVEVQRVEAVVLKEQRTEPEAKVAEVYEMIKSLIQESRAVVAGRNQPRHPSAGQKTDQEPEGFEKGKIELKIVRGCGAVGVDLTSAFTTDWTSKDVKPTVERWQIQAPETQKLNSSLNQGAKGKSKQAQEEIEKTVPLRPKLEVKVKTVAVSSGKNVEQTVEELKAEDLELKEMIEAFQAKMQHGTRSRITEKEAPQKSSQPMTTKLMKSKEATVLKENHKQLEEGIHEFEAAGGHTRSTRGGICALNQDLDAVKKLELSEKETQQSKEKIENLIPQFAYQAGVQCMEKGKAENTVRNITLELSTLGHVAQSVASNLKMSENKNKRLKKKPKFIQTTLELNSQHEMRITDRTKAKDASHDAIKELQESKIENRENLEERRLNTENEHDSGEDEAMKASQYTLVELERVHKQNEGLRKIVEHLQRRIKDLNSEAQVTTTKREVNNSQEFVEAQPGLEDKVDKVQMTIHDFIAKAERIKIDQAIDENPTQDTIKETKKQRNEAQELEGHLKKFQSGLCYHIESREEPQIKVEKSKKDLAAKVYSMTGLIRASKYKKHYNAQKRENRKLHQRNSDGLLDLKKSIKQLGDVMATLSAERKDHQSQARIIKSNHQELNALKSELSNARSILETTQRQMEEQATALSNTRKEREAQTGTIENSQQELNTLRSEVANSKSILRTTQKQMEELSTALSNTRKEKEAQSAIIENSQQELNALGNDAAHCKSMLEKTNKRVEELTTALSGIREEHEAQAKTLTNKCQELDELRKELEDSTKMMEVQRSQLQAVENERYQLLEAHQTLLFSYKEAQGALTVNNEGFQAKVKVLEEQLEETRKDWTKLNMDNVVNLSVIIEQNNQIEELKKQLLPVTIDPALLNEGLDTSAEPWIPIHPNRNPTGPTFGATDPFFGWTPHELNFPSVQDAGCCNLFLAPQGSQGLVQNGSGSQPSVGSSAGKKRKRS